MNYIRYRLWLAELRRWNRNWKRRAERAELVEQSKRRHPSYVLPQYRKGR